MNALTDCRYEDVDFEFYPDASHGIRTIVELFIRSFRYDYILLNGMLHNALFLALLKSAVPFHQAKIVLLDFLLPTPMGLKGRVKAWVIGWLMRRIHKVMLYYRNTIGLEKHFHIPVEKFVYVPFKINQLDLICSMTSTDGGYVFCGGKTRRDFSTLFEAVRDLECPIKVVTTDNNDIVQHGSYLDEGTVPSNVEVIRLDGTPEAFISYMAAARVVVLPIKPDICGAGIGVYLMAMALRKCVILSSGPGAEDILNHGQAIIVPASDPVSLRTAIEKAFRDSTYRLTYENNGFEYAWALQGEEKLVQSVIRVLHMDITSGGASQT